MKTSFEYETLDATSDYAHPHKASCSLSVRFTASFLNTPPHSREQ